MLPGGKGMRQAIDSFDERELVRTEAIIQSMTPQERKQSKLLNGSRRLRIARGAGVTVTDVNQLVSRFEQAAKMMKTVAKGGVPNMPGMGPMPPGMRAPKKAAKPQGKQQRRSGNPAKRQEPAVEAPQGSAFGKPKAEGAFGELSGPDQAALQRMLGNG